MVFSGYMIIPCYGCTSVDVIGPLLLAPLDCFMFLLLLKLYFDKCTNKMPQHTLTNATDAFAHLSVYFSPISWTYLYCEPLYLWYLSNFLTMNHGKKYIYTCNPGCTCARVRAHTHTLLHSEASSQKSDYFYCYSDVFILVYFHLKR